MQIKGIEGLSVEELNLELSRGAQFVIYQYCISIVVMTFKRPSHIYFVRSDQSKITKGLLYSLISLVFGWWGFPWGPIYTIGSFITNFGGGKIVTNEVLQSINRVAAA